LHWAVAVLLARPAASETALAGVVLSLARVELFEVAEPLVDHAATALRRTWRARYVATPLAT
jgi:hypothetical protein